MGTWREEHLKTAMSERYAQAQQELVGERGVLDYLRSEGKDGAARIVEANIVKMEQRVTRFRNEMTG